MDKIINELKKELQLLKELHWFTKDDNFLGLIDDIESTIKDIEEIDTSNYVVATAAMSMVHKVEANFRTMYEEYKEKQIWN